MSCDGKLATGIRALCAPGSPIAGACGGDPELAAAVLLELNDLARVRAAGAPSEDGRLAQIQARARAAQSADDATALLLQMQSAMAHDPSWRLPVHGDRKVGQAVPLPRDAAATEGLAAMQQAIAAANEGRALPLLAQQIRYARQPRQGDGPGPAMRQIIDTYPELLALANGRGAPGSRQHAALGMAYDTITRPGMGGAPEQLKEWRRALRTAGGDGLEALLGVVDDSSSIDALAPAAAASICAAAGVANCPTCGRFVSPTAAHTCPPRIEAPVAARMAMVAAGATTSDRLDALIPLIESLSGPEQDAARRAALRAVAAASFEQRGFAALRLLPYLEPGSDDHVALAVQALTIADQVLFAEQAAFLRDLIPHLPASELDAAWRLAHDLPQRPNLPPEALAARAEAIQAIQERLDPGGHRLLLETIVDITDVAPETRALLDRLPSDPHLAAAIWRTAQGWRGPYDQMRAGTFLYPYLPPAEREEVAEAIYKLDNDWWKYLGLDTIAEHMPDEREALTWRDRQLDVIHAMRDVQRKRNTLATFARVCPEQRWRDLIDVASRIADPVDRANALGGLVETAPDWALDEITDTVARLRSPEARAAGLAHLAQYVPEDQVGRIADLAARLPVQLQPAPRAALDRRAQSGRLWRGPQQMMYRDIPPAPPLVRLPDPDLSQVQAQIAQHGFANLPIADGGQIRLDVRPRRRPLIGDEVLRYWVYRLGDTPNDRAGEAEDSRGPITPERHAALIAHAYARWRVAAHAAGTLPPPPEDPTPPTHVEARDYGAAVKHILDEYADGGAYHGVAVTCDRVRNTIQCAVTITQNQAATANVIVRDGRVERAASQEWQFDGTTAYLVQPARRDAWGDRANLLAGDLIGQVLMSPMRQREQDTGPDLGADGEA